MIRRRIGHEHGYPRGDAQVPYGYSLIQGKAANTIKAGHFTLLHLTSLLSAHRLLSLQQQQAQLNRKPTGIVQKLSDPSPFSPPQKGQTNSGTPQFAHNANLTSSHYRYYTYATLNPQPLVRTRIYA